MKYIKNSKKSFLLLALVLVGVFSLTLLINNRSLKSEKEFLPASAGGIANSSPEYILVKFKAGISEEKKNQVINEHNLKEKSEIKNIGVKVISIPPGRTPESVIEALNKNQSDIDFAEPDFVVEPSVVPNDSWFDNWQKDKQQMNLPLAWDTTTTSNMTLAIVDTGVNCTHEDLNGLCTGGWNFYDNNADAGDINGHGTSVAGTAGALGNNSVGVAGITWSSKIMPIRVSAPDGTASYSNIANGIIYAADNGAQVVNASYSIGGSSTVESAAKYLRSKGGLLVSSMGNYSSNTGYTNSPNIIAVSGVDANDSLYSWSSFGNDVDISAPGCTGSTTKKDGGYGSFCGTSNSAPEVAGLLMLIWSANPSLTSDQVQNILFNSSKDLGPVGWDQSYGFGRVDAYAAVLMAKSGEVVTAPVLPTSPTTNTTPTRTKKAPRSR